MDYGTWVFTIYTMIALVVGAAQAIENHYAGFADGTPSPIVTGLMWPVWVVYLIVALLYALVLTVFAGDHQ